MASTEQQTKGSVTLKGSSDLVKEYLGMYNKFKNIETMFWSDFMILTYYMQYGWLGVYL